MTNCLLHKNIRVELMLKCLVRSKCCAVFINFVATSLQQSRNSSALPSQRVEASTMSPSLLLRYILLLHTTTSPPHHYCHNPFISPLFNCNRNPIHSTLLLACPIHVRQSDGQSQDYEMAPAHAWEALVRINSHIIPDVIFERYNCATSYALMGLFPEIKQA